MSRLDMLKEFAGNNPKDPFPRYGLAMEYKNAGRLEEAEVEFAHLLSTFPDYTPAYLHAGNLYRALGRRERAADVYRAGIDACERKGDGHALGEIEAALAELEGA